MNNAVYYVLVIVAGYFCGCIESGYLVGKLCGMDIRDYGSGLNYNRKKWNQLLVKSWKTK